MIKQHPEFPLLVSDDGTITLLDGTPVKYFLYNYEKMPAVIFEIPRAITYRISKDGKRKCAARLYAKKIIADCYLEIPGYKYAVINIDGDPWNLQVENLKIVPMSAYTAPNIIAANRSRRTRVSIDGIEYDSIQIAAKNISSELHYSYNTIYGFLSRIKNHKEFPGDTKFKIEHHVVLYEKSKK